jgi:hypothetical protein
LKHVRELAVVLLDLPQHVVAQEELFESSSSFVLLKSAIDLVQFTFLFLYKKNT